MRPRILLTPPHDRKVLDTKIHQPLPGPDLLFTQLKRVQPHKTPRRHLPRVDVPVRVERQEGLETKLAVGEEEAEGAAGGGAGREEGVEGLEEEEGGGDAVAGAEDVFYEGAEVGLVGGGGRIGDGGVVHRGGWGSVGRWLSL